ncbi:esterase/lipase family protein [Massilia sp. TWR1-2-2]|uniref:esterase/lipase family protein n=1 Tax=Massilia sp. TWR1-2-2 TaxID=2804584 RepID=UPI003CF7561B
MPSKDNERQIIPTYDREGNPKWDATMSPPDNTFGIVSMVADRIIPVIFIPGVMGSNLKEVGSESNMRWRLDSPKSMVGWMTKDANDRKKFLNPRTMSLDDDGLRPKGTAQEDRELKRRGWGEVGAMSYASFLVWLENALNDQHSPNGGERDRLIGVSLGAMKGECALTKEEVALSYKYRFPVDACGYNWLDDNVKAAIHLKARIEAVIARYRGEKKMCEKVILITHSMGGLVGRYCSELLGMSDKILGVVHGVMPAIGAAAVYRRFKAGTEGDLVAALVLGRNAAEMTAVLSSAPGPMQLLPTAEYGNGWLQIKDGKKLISFPQKGDPYTEIYTVRGKWWSMCDDKLINPKTAQHDGNSGRITHDTEWLDFVNVVKLKVRPFHVGVANRYHPNTHAFFGSHEDNRAYGNVTWSGVDVNVDDLLLRGGRNSDPLTARSLNLGEFSVIRNVAAPLDGKGWKKEQKQRYTIGEPDEPGDGTVPHRSGVCPRDSKNVVELMQVKVGHEPAFKDSDAAKRFTLRAVVKIAQRVTETSLRYQTP